MFRLALNLNIGKISYNIENFKLAMFVDKVNIGNLYSEFKFYLICNLKELLFKVSKHILYKINEKYFQMKKRFLETVGIIPKIVCSACPFVSYP